MKRPHRLILASAGTGKTYQLTGQYLNLLLEGVLPERILATTFTRKAAGEILDRVLRRLVEAVETDAKREELGRSVGRNLEREELARLLSGLVRRLDRFQIRTLDAFFVQLGQVFALELGLPADWTIVDEVEDVRLQRETLSRALAEASESEVISLLRGLQRSEASRSVERILLESVNEARSVFVDSTPEAWNFVQPPAGLSEEELARARAALEAMEVPRTKAGKEDKRWIKAKGDALAYARDGEWEKFISAGPLKAWLEGKDEYYGHPIDPQVFQPLLRQATHELLAELGRENSATRSWLERFERAYAELKREERAFRFDDLPHALSPSEGVPSEGQLDLWYRLDARIDHLLLDEFQDTSPSQWRILDNLASELFADGSGERSFFCVGDVKQSIYGWREAEPRLLSGLPERYPQLDPAEELSESFRSSPVVLDTVHRVFSAIGSNPCFAHRSSYRRAAELWQADYREHRAHHRDMPGASLLWSARAPAEDEDRDYPALELAAQRAAELVGQEPGTTVGVLLRRNKHIARQIYLLRREGLMASGEGGNPLTDSRAVLHLLSLLHWIDHPRDSAAYFHVATSPLSTVSGLSSGHDTAARMGLVARLRARLGEQGIGRFVDGWRTSVQGAYGPWDHKRFDQLIDLAYGFEDRVGLRPDSFVRYVRATPVEDPSTTQVKVMTIHAAKGLEFDAVLLPELDEEGFTRDLRLFSLRQDAAGPLVAASKSRRREVCELDPERLGYLRESQEIRTVREVLCVLYVAMTRAAHRLEMIVRHKSSSSSYAGILRAALAPFPADEKRLWAHPDNAEDWGAKRAPEALPATPAERSGLRFRPSEGKQRVRRTPSSQTESRRVAVRDLLHAGSSRARTRGQLLHLFFEQVEWIDDFDLEDGPLLELARPFDQDEASRREILSQFRAQLDSPVVRKALLRPSPAEGWSVWRERPFSVLLEEGGELWSGSFDRVTVKHEGDRCVRAVLLDFKTDRVSGRELERRARHYIPQMQAYRNVLAHMTGLAPGSIEAGLLFLESGELREIGPQGG